MAHWRCSLRLERSVKITAIVGLAVAVLPAVLPVAVEAQTANPQTPCRGVYLLGETVPPGCQASRRAGPQDYRQWGDGSGTTSATPPADDRRPSDYGLYHFGGHNALYGLGR